MVLGEYGSHPHALSKESFEGLFGVDTPAIINFHIYPAHVKALLFERNQSITRKRIEVLGYVCDELIRCVEVMMADLTCSDRRGHNHHLGQCSA